MTALLLAEVAEALAEHGRFMCRIEVEDADTPISVRLHIVPRDDEAGEALRVLELLHRLQYLRDVGQMRELCDRFEIDSRVLEALLPKEGA